LPFGLQVIYGTQTEQAVRSGRRTCYKMFEGRTKYYNYS